MHLSAGYSTLMLPIGEQRIVMRLLRRRIGEVEPELQAQIRSLPTTQLEELSEALLDFSTPEDLIAWLQAHLTTSEP